MRLLLCLLLVTYAYASEDEGRARKQPYVVDAVGNTLPPPSNVPATVGSPVNLLTPDRYEFYTFDESGELVKRLMTLEEIQAIVAAGEEAEGLVTFANDNQPTMAFNFSQPSYNKVHSVVTNVQNVLKAQMEAHKNNPVAQPTLDTPDVSNSWSLILPSIFGNTGLDIVPDKVPNVVSLPETDTLEFNDNLDFGPDSISKEGSNDVLTSSTTRTDILKPLATITTQLIEDITASPSTTSKSFPTVTTKMTPLPSTTTVSNAGPLKSTTTTSTTTLRPTKRTTTTKKSSTLNKIPSSATTAKPLTKHTTEITKKVTKPVTSTEPSNKIIVLNDNVIKTSTKAVPTTKNNYTSPVPNKVRSTTSRPKITSTTYSDITSTTTKFISLTSSTTGELYISKSTTSKPFTSNNESENFETTKIPMANDVTTTNKNSVLYEKIDTFVPISIATNTIERTTQKLQTIKPTETFSTTLNATTTSEKLTTVSEQNQPAITTYKPTTTVTNYILSTSHNQDPDKSNATTVTTQSVSPSTTVSSTEFITLENIQNSDFTEKKPVVESGAFSGDNESDMPIFDVAQSISQIASDLGGNYMPVPTVSNLMDTTKLNQIDLESKENFEIDILPENDTNTKNPSISGNQNGNFVKISTIDPHDQNTDKFTTEKDIVHKNLSVEVANTTEKKTVDTFESTTIDRVLSASMGDLLQQVVNQAPHSVLESENNFDNANKMTTDRNMESTTNYLFSDTTSETTIIIHPSTERDKSGNDIPSFDTGIQNATSSIVNITDVSVTEDAKVNSTEKNQGNIDDKSFVKISLNDKNNSTSGMVSDVNKIIDEISTDKKSDKYEIVSTTEDANKIKLPTTTTVTSTTVKSEFTTIKSISEFSTHVNEIKSNKNASTVEKIVYNITEKVPDDLPKIEDFKKKFQKVNIDDKELTNERNSSWKLISTVSPPKSNDVTKETLKVNAKNPIDKNSNKDIVLDVSKENQGLEVTTKDLEEDIAKFSELCNELAFRYWNTITENIDKRRSFVLSPYSITSMLAMMFMGARGATSGEMNDILKLDDMVTFNPHFTLKNISDSIETTPESGVIVSVFIRELYSDRNKGKILTFYKERAQQFYNGHVEEINFKLISDIIRRRTNLLVKRYTWGKISEYMKANTITMQPPLAAFSANIFQTDCTGSSVDGRDGEMYFVVSPTVRQRRLVPVPAVVYRGGFLAGYDPVLDATAAALGNTNSIISTLFVMPGQQGNVVHGEDLEALEQRLLDSNPTTPAWNRLLRTLLPRIGLELQIPRFSHKSIFNVSSTLRSMGLKDLFDADHADLGGLNGPSKDLYLSDMIQSNTFVTCAEGVIGEQHHVEEYPESLGNVARRRSSRWAADWDEPRDYQRAFHDPHDVGEAMHLPLHLRPRQARLPSRNAQPARLKFDRPFLYFVRHNPSGMILYVGRYNPRLLP